MAHSDIHLPGGALLQGGKYRIVRFISSGGFGCTYEAVHEMLEKRVAIKEFFVRDFCNRDEATAHVTVGTLSKKGLVEKLRKKFIDEAKGLCHLEHPGIVKVSDVFEENGTAYFVMDYVDGKSVSDIVKLRGSLSPAEALGYISQVCDALEYVHSHNRLHLDIKPGNIMVDKDGRAVLIDFGASKQYDEADGENTSTLMGKTPGYAPIEQMGNDVVRFMPATDIYALGATLYKMLTGITPPSANQLASGEELPALPAGVSPQVRNAITEAMRINKSKRPQSVAEFRSMLLKSSSNEDEEATVIAAEDPVIDKHPCTKPSPQPVAELSPKIAPKPKANPQPAPELDYDSSPDAEPKPNTYSKKHNYIIWGCIAVVALFCVFLILPSKDSETTNQKGREEIQQPVSVSDPDGYISNHGFVDLGLPSGLKWATCNVGAAQPEDYGDYFAWGETKPKSNYDENNSATCGKDDSWLRSNGYIDSSGNLTMAHDAARQNWGGTWRMPTKAELQELVDNTTSIWTTRDGVEGLLVTSKTNGNSIFLTAAGYRDGSTTDYAVWRGVYWGATRYEGNSSDASSLRFYASYFYSLWDYRYLGFSVRPVTE